MLGIFGAKKNEEAARNAAREEKDKAIAQAVEDLGNLRRNSAELNNRVSRSLDTAIIAGGEIGENIRSVEKKTRGLYDQISNASNASEEISGTITHWSTELDKHERAMTETGSAVEQINAHVQNVAGITRQKKEALEKLQKTIEAGAERQSLTGKSIAEVTTLVNEIHGVVQVINAVAAQTNLLAMNAAIEAAHAGDVGKGFAVVADEVRKLAESTSINSKSIAESIKNIVHKIDEAKKASTVAGESFANIQTEATSFAGAFDEIAHASEELRSGMNQILHSIGDVKSFSSEIATGSKEMAIGSNQINESLLAMKEYSRTILNDMGSITNKSADLTGSLGGVSQYAVDTNKALAALYRDLEEGKLLPSDGRAFNYDVIVLMHRNWLAQLRAFLDGRKDSLPVGDKDYMNCDLGKWIYGDGRQHSGNEHYRALETQHQKFHALAGDIYRAKQSGAVEKAEELYKALMDEYKTVVSLLSSMNQTINRQ